MNLYCAKLGKLTVEQPAFAAGGAGEVFRGRNTAGTLFCVKKLTAPKPQDFEKLTFMVSRPPAVLKQGWGQLCWPLDLVGGGAQSIRPIGYVMPMAFPGSVELSNLTHWRWPKKTPSPLAAKLDRSTDQGKASRMKVGCNVAAAVNEIHKLGYVFVDLKPQNVLIAEDGMVSVVDLDSLQIQAPAQLFRGPLGSPEYMPSESYTMNHAAAPLIEPSWDRFALAVILYEILLGIHPYTATAKPTISGCDTIADSIRMRMYVHGANRGQLEVIPPPHAGLAALPRGLVSLFARAFDSAAPKSRPAAEEWGVALVAALSEMPAGATAAVPFATRPARPVSTDGQLHPCYGPIGKVCQHERQGARRRGLPNSFGISGTPIFLCPDCLSPPAQSTPKGQLVGVKCHGPWGRTCPSEKLGQPRYGALNSTRSSDGAPVYLCPDCFPAPQGKSNASSPLESCYGPWGQTCPHERLGRPRFGMPNRDQPQGHRVYICPDCVKL